ncbi:MAG: hypothetical protein ACP5QK_09595 [Myxococcota bacterium]
MKNRLTGILMLVSIVFVFSFIFPFERNIAVEIDKRYTTGIKEIDIIFFKDNKMAYEKRYFPEENFFRFHKGIEDKIRLSRGRYDLKVYLIYRDDYILKEKELNIGIKDFTKVIMIGE